MSIDPRILVRHRVEKRLSLHSGRSVRVSRESNDLIGTIRDHMVIRKDPVAKLEVRLLLEECLTELDELEKAHS